MKTFKKVIKTETMKDVMHKYYKKDALETLIHDNSNNASNSILLDLYTEKFSHWKQAMDKAEHEALEDLYTKFQYNYTMEFATNTMVLTTEVKDNNIINHLKEIGFVES